MQYIWLAIMILALIAEALTPQLTTVWFAAGALCALITALITPENIVLQAVIFTAVSGIAILLTRSLAKKFINGKKQAINADRIIGQEAIVTETIDNILGRGLVNVGGVAWTARTQDNTSIAEGELVRILSIQGVKVIVEKINKTED